MKYCPKILFPPGIGDAYWSLVKLQSFLKQKDLGKPDIYIASREDEYNSQNRGFPFLEMFSFINSTNVVLDVDAIDESFWQNAYTQNKTGIFENVLGCDYFIVYNGAINSGMPLEEIDPHIKCNWELPMFFAPTNIKSRMQSRYGRYIVYHFGTRGTYQYWVDEFPIKKIIKSIKLISEETKTIPILVGGSWDIEDEGLTQIANESKCIDMRGKTSLDRLFGMIKGAQLFIGFPSGIIMVAPTIGAKTLALWSGLYPEATSWNVVSPDVRNIKYWTKNTKELTIEGLLEKVKEVI